MDIKVEALVVKIGDIELKLTPEDATKLRDELNKVLTPKFSQPIYIDRYPTFPSYPQYPYYTWGSNTIPLNDPSIPGLTTTTCNSDINKCLILIDNSSDINGKPVAKYTSGYMRTDDVSIMDYAFKRTL